jgi:hypothetical protein
MVRAQGTTRKFLWWCAAVDPDLMSEPACPPIDGTKYAIVGALVCITTAVATVGWIDIAALATDGVAPRLPLSICLGVLMGILVLTMERMLIVSIPARLSLVGRTFAVLWRGALAAFTAAIMTLPIALGYYHNEIGARLDDEKLQRMQEKREVIDVIFGLNRNSTAVERLETALAANRQLKEQLPLAVREIGTKATSCFAEERKQRELLQFRIASAVNRRNSIRSRLVGAVNEDSIL